MSFIGILHDYVVIRNPTISWLACEARFLYRLCRYIQLIAYTFARGSYVKKGFYSDTTFHRVIPGFMIQGGGFTAEMKVKSTDQPIRNEAANGLKNDRGTLAMARTANPDSATSQFFINVVNNSGLNRPLPDGYGYAVFGKVIEGMNVVDKIAEVKTGTMMGSQDVPLVPVIIKSIKIVK